MNTAGNNTITPVIATRINAATRTRTAVDEQARNEERNRTYVGYMKTYKSYIDSKRENMNADDFKTCFNLNNHVVGASPYVSVKACEEFFVDIVYPRPISRYSAMKYVYAIGALAKLENTRLPSQALKTNLIIQNLELMDKRQAGEDKKANRDPHDKLTTNIVSQEELSRVLCNLLTREQQWERTATKISSLSTTLIRHNNSVKITFSKLVYINRLPPNGIKTPHDSEQWESIEDPFSEMLGFIIPPHDQIKKNGSYGQKRTEVVGGFRHKRYERCFIGMIAMSLLVKFQNIDYTKNVSFLAQENTDEDLHEGSPDSDNDDTDNDDDDDDNEDLIEIDEHNLHWRHHQVFQKGYQSTYRAVRKAFQRAGVPFWEKVTHLRYVLGSTLFVANCSHVTLEYHQLMCTAV